MRNAGCVLRFKRKRKIANAKIYEDKRDLYCNVNSYSTQSRTHDRPTCNSMKQSHSRSQNCPPEGNGVHFMSENVSRPLVSEESDGADHLLQKGAQHAHFNVLFCWLVNNLDLVLEEVKSPFVNQGSLFKFLCIILYFVSGKASSKAFL